ncbi:transcriptional regulator with XRE-family HTH domain [Streptomyces sp. LBL]|uniref:helix-turn-helix domain-containing protein n=1 Tax=Streptomyces sp. LBL TaxID=2940562 RepID=UPI0024739029|nr:XRE family transcriptional regulator [Streptomyces sp. LBL]MDH6624339.1 transcriptional regulator with XRE-family HTH domain [Streptomyces sp. LBL]
MNQDRSADERDQSLDEVVRASKQAVAERLRHIRQHHPEGPFTLATLADRTHVSARTLAQAESAEGANVTLETLAKVAHSLGIRRIAYFLDEAVFQQVNAELDMLTQMREQGVEGVVARRAAPTGLPPASVEQLARLLHGIVANAEQARTALQELPPAQ